MTQAYSSTMEHSDSCAYSSQVSLRPVTPAQNARWSTCWGDQTGKWLAAGTPGDCRHGCRYVLQQNGKLELPSGKKQGALDPTCGPEFGTP